MPLDIPSSARRLPTRAPNAVVAAIPVSIVSPDPLVVAALRARLSNAPELWVVDDPARAAIIVWDPPSPASPGELPSLPSGPSGAGDTEPGRAEPAGVIALIDEGTDPMPLLAAGVRGLVNRDIDAGQLRATIVAAQLGLTVLHEDPADAIVAAWSPPRQPAPAPGRDRLTPREHEVLALLADGLSNRAIGAALGISAHTVKFHVDALLDKLAARSRTQVVVKAVREGLLELV